jgi:hypothetical protein
MIAPESNETPRPRLTVSGGCFGDHQLIKFTRADQAVYEPVEWLVENWLAHDTLAGLIGASGTCKSFLALEWACCVATGWNWHGIPVKKGPAFYLAGEGNSGLRKRIAGWQIANERPIDGAPLYLANCLPDLCDQQSTSNVIRAVEDSLEELFFKSGEDPSLIIIDTLAIAMSGYDENAASDMGLLIQAVSKMRNRWRCCVLLIHHTGHNANAKARARGSSVFRAALDSEFLVTSTQQDLIKVTGTKAKDWDLPERRLRKTRITLDVPGVACNGETTLILSDAVDDRPKANPKRERALELLRENQSQRRIADQLGISTSTVSRWAAMAAASEAKEHRRSVAPCPIPTPDKGVGTGWDAISRGCPAWTTSENASAKIDRPRA